MQPSRNGAQVREWMRQKQELEVRLAWDLLETFNTTPGLIGPLRNMAEAALDEMRAFRTTSAVGSAAVTQAWLEETRANSGLCRKYVGFNHIHADPNRDAQECSDVIRLYGAFVEKAGDVNFQDYAAQKQQKDALRTGGRQVWGKDPKTEFAGRHRWNVDDKVRPGGPTRGEQLRQEAPALVQSGQGGPWQVHSFLKSQGGGIKKFILADTSTINKIGRVYGLVQGADISGTTSDSIYFMNRFGGAGLDPIFQVLPLATIVAGAHHSMLEVALSLSQAGVVDYHIGFYKSLLPAGATAGAAEIGAALAAAEHSPMNPHLLVYYNQIGLVGGCFRFEGRDLWGFRNFSNGRSILRHFWFMPPWPLEADIRDYCHRHRLRLD